MVTRYIEAQHKLAGQNYPAGKSDLTGSRDYRQTDGYRQPNPKLWTLSSRRATRKQLLPWCRMWAVL